MARPRPTYQSEILTRPVLFVYTKIGSMPMPPTHHPSREAKAFAYIFKQLIWLSGLFYRLSALNVKLSVLMLYLRLFTLHGFNPRFRLLVLFSICAVLLVFGAFIFVAIFGCSPVDMFWNRSKKGWCINFLPFYYVHIGMEVFLDIWVMLLPVEIIGELNLPRKTRWGLVVLFGLGLL